MENMKMADIWGWDSIPQNYGHYEAFTFNGTERKGDFYGFLFCTEEAAEGTAHALRNHDRLVEENAQQRESLDAFRELVKAQTKTMNELNEKCKELAEENAELRKTLKRLVNIEHERGGSLGVNGQFYYKVPESIFEGAKKLLSK